MGTSSRKRPTSLANALFSRTQQRVLGILYGQPERSFYVTEIFQRAAAGRGTVQRELARLADSGLAIVTRIGNQKHYRANQAAPIFSELRSIVMKTVGLADPITDALAPLAKRIDLALIYGSVARGEAHARSDVDLLIVARDVALAQVYARLAPAEASIGRPIHVTLLRPAEFRSRRDSNNAFLRKALAGDTIPLIGRIDAEP